MNLKPKNMIRNLILMMFVLFAFNANANTENNRNPLYDFISHEIEKLELEQELFGDVNIIEALCIASIEVYELEEEVNLDFNTANYLPVGFEARAGLSEIDWTGLKLVELEEEVEFDFEIKAYLPEGFDPYKGMNCTNETEMIIQ